MECIGCGNCEEENVSTYYCPAQNRFIIKETKNGPLKNKTGNWKKGSPEYETSRRFRKEDKNF